MFQKFTENYTKGLYNTIVEKEDFKILIAIIYLILYLVTRDVGLRVSNAFCMCSSGNEVE